MSICIKNNLIETFINCDTLVGPKLYICVLFSYLSPCYLFYFSHEIDLHLLLVLKKLQIKLTGTILFLLLDKNLLKFRNENGSFQCKLSRPEIKCYRNLEYRLEQLSLSLEGSISTNIS